MSKQQLIVLDKIDPNQLPELANFKAKGFSLLKECSFIKIEDNSTYETAKKHRTALKSYRTDVQKSEKAIKDKINSFKNKVQIASAELIEITQVAENKQQYEITIWETKKEQERLEKLRLEEERIDGIKKSIGEFRQNWEDLIGKFNFESIETIKNNFDSDVKTFDRDSLQEFEVLFDDAVSYLTNLLNSKIKTLTEQEQIRIDNLLIQEKNAENSRIQEWQRTWNANIDTLTFDDIKDVKSVLVKSKLADLKHYSNEYEEIYTSTEKRLHSQIELISKAETQRIAQEKFQKEKAELERKQEEAKKTSEFEIKIKNRIIELVSYGLKFYFNSTYTDGNFFVDILDIKTHDDKKWDKLISDIVRVQKAIADKEIIESVIVPKTDEIAQEQVERIYDSEPIVAETITIVGEAIIYADYREEDVYGIATTKTDSFVERMIPIVDQQNLIDLKNAQNELLKEVTWESIYDDEFKNSKEYKDSPSNFLLGAFFNFLKENYNVPTKKQ